MERRNDPSRICDNEITVHAVLKFDGSWVKTHSPMTQSDIGDPFGPWPIAISGLHCSLLLTMCARYSNFFLVYRECMVLTTFITLIYDSIQREVMLSATHNTQLSSFIPQGRPAGNMTTDELGGHLMRP